jgi:ribonuclease Z
MVGVSSAAGAVLIDCGGDVLQRAMAAGIDVADVSAVILTHEHPDHVGGWPLLMEKLWLHGRKEPIPVFGPEPALLQAQRCFAIFNTKNWKGLPDVLWNPVPLDEQVEFLTVGPLVFTSSPTDHGVPGIAVRVDNSDSSASICYSSDTRPSPVVARLAEGCDVLVHEANGVNPVHSTAEEAAEIARSADAGRLVLVHLPPGLSEDDLGAAKQIFADLELGEELATYLF